MGDDQGMRLGLTGWPLERSLSPVIHSTFLQWAGIPGEYTLCPLRPEELRDGLLRLGDEGFTGINVTYPHKHRAAELCDVLEGDAALLGMVNTIAWEAGVMTGWNTDTIGFDRMLCGVDTGDEVLLVGSGGAARAVDLVFHRMNVPCTVFCSNPENWSGISPATHLDHLRGRASGLGSGTVVNATTLGWDDRDGFPLDIDDMIGLTFVDLNYNPSWDWRNGLAGISTGIFTGETMLVFQAAGSFRIWTGLTVPVTEALLAVRPVLIEN